MAASPKPKTQTVNVDAVLATIRQQESGGNYTIVTSGGSDACGAYQYISSTWQAMFDRALAAGALPAGAVKTSRACQAPPAVQDAVARYDVTTFLNSVGGNVALVPLHWYYPAAVTNPALLNYTPPGNSISIGDYQRNWLGTYAKFANDPTAIARAGQTGTSGGSGQTAQTTGIVEDVVGGIVGGVLGPAGTVFNALTGGALKSVTAPFAFFISLSKNWRYFVEIGAGLLLVGVAIFLLGKHTFEDRVKEVGPAVAAAAA